MNQNAVGTCAAMMCSYIERANSLESIVRPYENLETIEAAGNTFANAVDVSR
jgi:hypothetical protein